MDVAFPGVLPLSEPTAKMKRDLEEAKGEGRPLYWQRRPARRFAGDESLPSGRYFIVANSESGDDRGTLLHERAAYAIQRMAEQLFRLI